MFNNQAPWTHVNKSRVMPDVTYSNCRWKHSQASNFFIRSYRVQLNSNSNSCRENTDRSAKELQSAVGATERELQLIIRWVKVTSIRQEQKKVTMFSPVMPSCTVALPTSACSSNLSPVIKSTGKVMVTFLSLAFSMRDWTIWAPSSSKSDLPICVSDCTYD